MQKVNGIPTWTTQEEREFVASISKSVKRGGLIVEIGSLYGGMTAILAKANPYARIITIDRFSWQPKGFPRPTAQIIKANLARLKAKNVQVVQGDSKIIGEKWKAAIDLLWIDGGHSYESVTADLKNFSPHAKAIILHDYNHPTMTGVTEAVDDFLYKNKKWRKDKSAGKALLLVSKGRKKAEE